MQRAAWLTESIICEVYVNNSKTEKSVDVCAKTIDFPAKALAHEPENGVVAYDLAVSHFNLARAYRLEGDLPRSIASGDRAVEVMAALSAKEPENNEYSETSLPMRPRSAEARSGSHDTIKPRNAWPGPSRH